MVRSDRPGGGVCGWLNTMRATVARSLLDVDEVMIDFLSGVRADTQRDFSGIWSRGLQHVHRELVRGLPSRAECFASVS